MEPVPAFTHTSPLVVTIAMPPFAASIKLIMEAVIPVGSTIFVSATSPAVPLMIVFVL